MLDSTSEYISELYKRYSPAVYRRANSLLRDPNEALDVVQDTFVCFMSSETLPVNVVAPFSMLYQIATHRALDRLRKRSRWTGSLRPFELRDSEDSEQEEWAVATDDRGAARIDALHDLSLLIHGESLQTVNAAVLYFVEGFSMDDVGRELELTRRDVSNLLQDFMKRARSRSIWLERGGSS